MPHKSLNPQKIAETAEKLSRRIHERFPEAGLHRISKELIQQGNKARDTAPMIARPIYSVRIAVGVLIAIIVGIVGSLIWVVLP